MPILSFSSLSCEAMEALARRLAPLLKPGDTITLEGEVGAGKTTFARALILALAKDAPEVTSPTFTLMQSYEVTLADGTRQTLWHLDLYRLEKEAELEALGLEELWPQLVLIEWPEITRARLPGARLAIRLAFAGEESRTLEFSGNDAWRRRLETLA